MTLELIRKNRQGKAVTGTINIPFSEGNRLMKTLENADFIIPPGIYPCKRTWSPKFKKLLPEITEVPEREGIRIHAGSKPEHSKGCILLSFEDMQFIQVFFNRLQINYQDDELYLEIKEKPGLGRCAA